MLGSRRRAYGSLEFGCRIRKDEKTEAHAALLSKMSVLAMMSHLLHGGTVSGKAIADGSLRRLTRGLAWRLAAAALVNRLNTDVTIVVVFVRSRFLFHGRQCFIIQTVGDLIEHLKLGDI